MNFLKTKMKNKYLNYIILLFYLTALCNHLQGQPIFTDSDQAYDYWSKRGIIEVVNAYMKDYILTVTDLQLPKDKIKNCQKEEIGLNKFGTQFIVKINEMSHNDFDASFNSLSTFLINNNWGGADKNLVQPLLKNRLDRKPLDVDFFVTYKPIIGEFKSTDIPGFTNKMVNWDETTTRIISEYNKSKNGIHEKPKLSKIIINPSSIIVEPRQSYSFTAKGYDQYDKEIEIASIEWNTTTGNISNDGQLTAGKIEGDFKVTASLNKILGSATVNIQKKVLTSNYLVTFLFFLSSFILGCCFIFFWTKARIFSIIGNDSIKYLNKLHDNDDYCIVDYIAVIEILKERKDFHKNKGIEFEKTIENLKIGKIISPDNEISSVGGGDSDCFTN